MSNRTVPIIGSEESTQSKETGRAFVAPNLSVSPSLKSQTLDGGTHGRLQAGDGLDQITAKDGEMVRLAIVPGSPLEHDMVHHIDRNGKFPRTCSCTAPACAACLSGDEPEGLLVALACRYVNADPATGHLANEIVPIYKVGYLAFSNAEINTILGGVQGGCRAADVDWGMSFVDGCYEFQVIATKALHITRGETEKIVALAEPLLPLLASKLGSPMPMSLSKSTAPTLMDIDD